MVDIKQVEYSKEIDAVASLLVEVVALTKAKVQAGMPVTTIVMELAAAEFGKLVAAIGAVSQVDDNVVENRKVALQTMGYRMGELVDAIL